MGATWILELGFLSSAGRRECLGGTVSECHRRALYIGPSAQVNPYNRGCSRITRCRG